MLLLKIRLFKSLLCLSLCLACGASSKAMADSILNPNSMEHRDFQLHTAVAYGMSFTGSQFLKKYDAPLAQRFWIPAVTVLALGLFKEKVIDKKYDGHDMAGNFTGVGLAAGMFYFLEF